MMTYFATQLKVDHDDGDLRAADDENDEDEEEEAEQVVVLVLPDGLQSTKIR